MMGDNPTTRIDITDKAEKDGRKQTTMTCEKTDEQCDIFRRKEDIDAMREFAHWLSNGGMDSLRDMQQTANDYNRVRDIGFGMIVKAIWGAVLLAFGLGGLALIKRYGE